MIVWKRINVAKRCCVMLSIEVLYVDITWTLVTQPLFKQRIWRWQFFLQQPILVLQHNACFYGYNCVIQYCCVFSETLHFLINKYSFFCFTASVSRLLKYWQTPLLTTGALTFDFSKNKTLPNSEFHLLVRMGHLSFAAMAHFTIALLNEWVLKFMFYLLII